MYVGRIAAVARNRAGRICALYRVSSRSYPNRRVLAQEDRAAITPLEGFESDIRKNPYIAYNCCRLQGDFGVVSNGAQTDVLADKLSCGLPPRDALVTVLHAMDYKHDSLRTPRIAGIVNAVTDEAWLGAVSPAAVCVRRCALEPGHLQYVATYTDTEPGRHADPDFDADSAGAGCDYILGRGVFDEFELAVSALCILADARGVFTLAAKDAVSRA